MSSVVFVAGSLGRHDAERRLGQAVADLDGHEASPKRMRSAMRLRLARPQGVVETKFRLDRVLTLDEGQAQRHRPDGGLRPLFDRHPVDDTLLSDLVLGDEDTNPPAPRQRASARLGRPNGCARDRSACPPRFARRRGSKAGPPRRALRARHGLEHRPDRGIVRSRADTPRLTWARAGMQMSLQMPYSRTRCSFTGLSDLAAGSGRAGPRRSNRRWRRCRVLDAPLRGRPYHLGGGEVCRAASSRIAAAARLRPVCANRS